MTLRQFHELDMSSQVKTIRWALPLAARVGSYYCDRFMRFYNLWTDVVFDENGRPSLPVNRSAIHEATDLVRYCHAVAVGMNSIRTVARLNDGDIGIPDSLVADAAAREAYTAFATVLRGEIDNATVEAILSNLLALGPQAIGMPGDDGQTRVEEYLASMLPAMALRTGSIAMAILELVEMSKVTTNLFDYMNTVTSQSPYDMVNSMLKMLLAADRLAEADPRIVLTVSHLARASGISDEESERMTTALAMGFYRGRVLIENAGKTRLLNLLINAAPTNDTIMETVEEMSDYVSVGTHATSNELGKYAISEDTNLFEMILDPLALVDNSSTKYSYPALLYVILTRFSARSALTFENFCSPFRNSGLGREGLTDAQINRWKELAEKLERIEFIRLTFEFSPETYFSRPIHPVFSKAGSIGLTGRTLTNLKYINYIMNIKQAAYDTANVILMKLFLDASPRDWREEDKRSNSKKIRTWNELLTWIGNIVSESQFDVMLSKPNGITDYVDLPLDLDYFDPAFNGRYSSGSGNMSAFKSTTGQTLGDLFVTSSFFTTYVEVATYITDHIKYAGVGVLAEITDPMSEVFLAYRVGLVQLGKPVCKEQFAVVNDIKTTVDDIVTDIGLEKISLTGGSAPVYVGARDLKDILEKALEMRNRFESANEGVYVLLVRRMSRHVTDAILNSAAHNYLSAIGLPASDYVRVVHINDKVEQLQTMTPHPSELNLFDLKVMPYIDANSCRDTLVSMSETFPSDVQEDIAYLMSRTPLDIITIPQNGTLSEKIDVLLTNFRVPATTDTVLPQDLHHLKHIIYSAYDTTTSSIVLSPRIPIDSLFIPLVQRPRLEDVRRNHVIRKKVVNMSAYTEPWSLFAYQTYDRVKVANELFYNTTGCIPILINVKFDKNETIALKLTSNLEGNVKSGPEFKAEDPEVIEARKRQESEAEQKKKEEEERLAKEKMKEDLMKEFKEKEGVQK